MSKLLFSAWRVSFTVPDPKRGWSLNKTLSVKAADLLQACHAVLRLHPDPTS